MSLIDETVNELKEKGVDGDTINKWISKVETYLRDSENEGTVTDVIRNMIPIILDPAGRKEIERFLAKVLDLDYKIHLDRIIEPIEPFLMTKLPETLREGYEEAYNEHEHDEPKRTLAEIDIPKRDLTVEIKDLMSQGWSQGQISEKMNIHDKTLSTIIGEIREEEKRSIEAIREEEKRINETPIWRLFWVRITRKIRKWIT